jgi:hypothetical protein
VRRRLGSLPRAFKEANAERKFEVCDDLGNSGLGHVEARGSFSHTARFDDRHKNIEVAQFETVSDAIVPRHAALHSLSL